MVPKLAMRPALSPRRPGLVRALRLVADRALRARIARFLAVGSVGFAIDAASFTTFSGLGASDVLARAASLGAATLVTWQLNRCFTFASSGRNAAAEGVRYAIVALCVQGFNYGLFLTLRTLAPSLPALAALITSAGTAAGLSFAGQAVVTFGSRLWISPASAPLGARP